MPFEQGGEAAAGLHVPADTAHTHDEATIKVVQAHVAQAFTVLRLAGRPVRHHDTGADQKAAMASRSTIDLPVGIIVSRNRCTQREAFQILRAASGHRNVELRDLAAGPVATVGQGPATAHVEP